MLTKQTSGKRTTFHLKVRQTDVGKVIGKHGQTIVAMSEFARLRQRRAARREKAQLPKS